ncbi:hypothetical protein [Nocardia abscessus]|uniref:hypothetical protein n=1 Tax=Nocardia abscessus TaxID=120957 RepID=UPI00313B6F00
MARAHRGAAQRRAAPDRARAVDASITTAPFTCTPVPTGRATSTGGAPHGVSLSTACGR